MTNTQKNIYDKRTQTFTAFDHPKVNGKKNGIPLYPNLVNLKSNTMKNTLQRYILFRKMQGFCLKKCICAYIFNLTKAYCRKKKAYFERKPSNCYKVLKLFSCKSVSKG